MMLSWLELLAALWTIFQLCPVTPLFPGATNIWRSPEVNLQAPQLCKTSITSLHKEKYEKIMNKHSSTSRHGIKTLASVASSML
jgi:hypothetical protein